MGAAASVDHVLVTTSQRTDKRPFVLKVIAALKAKGLDDRHFYCQDIEAGGQDWLTQWMAKAQTSVVIPCFVCKA